MTTRLLGPLGIPELDEEIYLFLLRHPETTIAEIVDASEASMSAVRQALARLESEGLASRTGHRPARFVPSAPRTGLENLVANRKEELERIRDQAFVLEEIFDARKKEAPSPVEVAVGAEAIVQRLRQMQQTATEEVIILETPPYQFYGEGPNPDELAALGRGIRYRVVYAQQSLEAAGKIDAVRESVEAGEEARVISSVPFKFMAVDSRVGLTYEMQKSQAREALVLHQSSLLTALLSYFDVLWRQAIPLRFSNSESKASSDLEAALDHDVLTLLSAGVNDDAIARQLGINVRTVRRRVARLLAITGAQTRFQAGVYAARNDLV